MNKVKMFDIKHEKMEEDSLHQWCCSCHCSPADGDHFMHLKHRLLLQCKRKRLNVYMFKFHHIFHIFRETKPKRLDKVTIIKWTVDKMWFSAETNCKYNYKVHFYFMLLQLGVLRFQENNNNISRKQFLFSDNDINNLWCKILLSQQNGGDTKLKHILGLYLLWPWYYYWLNYLNTIFLVFVHLPESTINIVTQTFKLLKQIYISIPFCTLLSFKEDLFSCILAPDWSEETWGCVYVLNIQVESITRHLFPVWLRV